LKLLKIEIIKEVEVVKQIDFASLQKMMSGMKTVEVSKKVVGETRTKKEGKVVERRELGKGKKATKVQGKATKLQGKATKVETKVKTSTKKAKPDDLTKIEGVGPKIAGLLHKGGITSFKALAGKKFMDIKNILMKAGPKYQMHDPGTWAKQAKLAADGKWKALEKLQDELSGGK